MLQIIGWLLCTALFVFGLSMLGNPNYQVDKEGGGKKMTETAHMAAFIAMAASLAFGVLFYLQFSSFDGGYSVSPTDPQLEADALRDARAAEAVAEDAMNGR